MGCCPPFENARACALPSQPWAQLDVREPKWDDLNAWFGTCDQDAVDATVEISSAAFSLLREHIDIVAWVLCLISGYVPRVASPALANANLDTLVQGVTQMILGVPPNPAWPGWGQLPPFLGWPSAPEWQLTVKGWRNIDGVASAEHPASSVPFTDPNGDGSVGVDVWAYSTRVQNFLANFASADVGQQLCGVAGLAGELLHEMVHVWVKVDSGGVPLYGYHTWYPDEGPPPDPWDTARMAKGAFLWALAQRYPSGLSYSADEFLTSDAPPVPGEPSAAYPCSGSLRGPVIAYPCAGGGAECDPPPGNDPAPGIPGDLPGLEDVRPWQNTPWDDGGPVVMLDGAVLL